MRQYIVACFLLALVGCPEEDVPITRDPAPFILVYPTIIDLATGNAEESATATVTVTNTGTGALVVDDIAVDATSSYSTDFAGPLHLEGGASELVTIGFGPKYCEHSEGVVTFHSNDALKPEADVSVAGTGLFPSIEIYPDLTDFGDVAIGDYAILPVVVRNDCEGILTVTELVFETQSDELYTIVYWAGDWDLSPGEEKGIEIVYEPADAGTDTAILHVISNDPANPDATHEVVGSGV